MEQASNTPNHLDESPENHTKLKKTPIPKEYAVCDSIYLTFLEYQLVNSLLVARS